MQAQLVEIAHFYLSAMRLGLVNHEPIARLSKRVVVFVRNPTGRPEGWARRIERREKVFNEMWRQRLRKGGRILLYVLAVVYLFAILDDLSSIESSLSSIESDISSIQSDVSSIQSDVSSIQTDVSSIEGNTETIEANTER